MTARRTGRFQNRKIERNKEIQCTLVDKFGDVFYPTPTLPLPLKGREIGMRFGSFFPLPPVPPYLIDRGGEGGGQEGDGAW